MGIATAAPPARVRPPETARLRPLEADAQDTHDAHPTRPADHRVLVLLGGVPGAGKTTLLGGLRDEAPSRPAPQRPAVRALDPDPLRHRLAAALPDGVPYRWYRPLVHVVHAVRVLAAVLRGPRRGRPPLVVHDPSTRPRRRERTGALARWRGWEPVLFLVDVSREDALAGQHARGRVLRPRSFDGHWSRWQAQRPALSAAARSPLGSGPWRRVVVVDRDVAPAAIREVLGS